MLAEEIGQRLVRCLRGAVVLFDIHDFDVAAGVAVIGDEAFGFVEIARRSRIAVIMHDVVGKGRVMPIRFIRQLLYLTALVMVSSSALAVDLRHLFTINSITSRPKNTSINMYTIYKNLNIYLTIY